MVLSCIHCGKSEVGKENCNCPINGCCEFQNPPLGAMNPDDLPLEAQTAEAWPVELVVFGSKITTIRNMLNVSFDCRSLDNPHSIFPKLTGFDQPVIDYVKQSPTYDELCSLIVNSILVYKHSRVGIYCTGGRHRSVVVANDVAQRLTQRGLVVKITYLNVEEPR